MTECEIQFISSHTLCISESPGYCKKLTDDSDEALMRADRSYNILCYISAEFIFIRATSPNTIFHKPSNPAAVINIFHCFSLHLTSKTNSGNKN
jgi:hypothetical protein